MTPVVIHGPIDVIDAAFVDDKLPSCGLAGVEVLFVEGLGHAQREMQALAFQTGVCGADILIRAFHGRVAAPIVHAGIDATCELVVAVCIFHATTLLPVAGASAPIAEVVVGADIAVIAGRIVRQERIEAAILLVAEVLGASVAIVTGNRDSGADSRPADVILRTRVFVVASIGVGLVDAIS